jgi:hypothetical protein
LNETMPHSEVAPLAPLVGEWEVRAMIPGAAPTGVRGRTVFEWILGGRFLLQRSGADHPDAPDGFSVIAPDGDGFRQHYFDSRGVVRLYAMTLQDGRWTLLREAADFSPLHFTQRYVGAFEDGGNTGSSTSSSSTRASPAADSVWREACPLPGPSLIWC